MHPTIAEQLAKHRQRDRLVEAMQSRLVREARRVQRAERSDPPTSVTAERRGVVAVLHFLWQLV